MNLLVIITAALLGLIAIALVLASGQFLATLIKALFSAAKNEDA